MKTQLRTRAHKNIARSFKPLFWSYSKLDILKNKKTIILNLINYGDLKEWSWLVGQYGRKDIKKVLSTIPATALRARVRPLVGVIFNIKKFNYAPRGFRRKR